MQHALHAAQQRPQTGGLRIQWLAAREDQKPLRRGGRPLATRVVATRIRSAASSRSASSSRNAVGWDRRTGVVQRITAHSPLGKGAGPSPLTAADGNDVGQQMELPTRRVEHGELAQRQPPRWSGDFVLSSGSHEAIALDGGDAGEGKGREECDGHDRRHAPAKTKNWRSVHGSKAITPGSHSHATLGPSRGAVCHLSDFVLARHARYDASGRRLGARRCCVASSSSAASSRGRGRSATFRHSSTQTS